MTAPRGPRLDLGKGSEGLTHWNKLGAGPWSLTMETQAPLLWPLTNICQQLLAEQAKTSSSLFCVCWPWVSSIPPSTVQLAAHHETCGFGWAGDRLLLLLAARQGRHTWCWIHGRVDPAFGETRDMQFCSPTSKEGGWEASSLPTYYALISPGKLSLVAVVGRNGLADKINIPFVLLVTPAVREILLIF